MSHSALEPVNLFILLGGCVLAGVVLYRNFWRALLCVAPSTLSVESEDPPDRIQLPVELRSIAAELMALDFAPIGSRREKPKFAPATIAYDYANAKDRVFATLNVGRDGRPRLYFLTPVANGGFVITANYRRPAREVRGRYLAGSLDDFPPERVYKAHLRRIESLPASGEYTQEGRLEAAKAWVAGPGRGELRQQNLAALVWTAGTLGILAAAAFGKR